MAASLKAKGNEFFKKQNWDKAIEMYTEAINLNENGIEYHTYYSNRSACYAGKNDYNNALNDAIKCIQLKPDFIKGYSRKGLALFRLKKYQESKKCYEDGLKINSNDASLKAGLDQCNKMIEKQKQNENNPFAKMFEPSKVYWTIQNNPELREYANDASFMKSVNFLIKNPQMAMQMNMLNDPKMSKLLSALLGLPTKPSNDDNNENENNNNNNNNDNNNDDIKNNNNPKTDVDNDGDINIDATDEKDEELTEEQKQEREAERKRIEEERKIQNEALKVKEEGNALYKNKKFDEAIVKYKKAQEIDPKNPSYILNESAVLFMQKKFDECIECCQKAIKCCEINMSDYKWKFKAYERIGKIHEQKKDINKAIEFYNKALLEKSDKKLRDYIKKLQKKEQKRKDREFINPEISLQLKDEGNEFFKQGKWDKALDKYSLAIKRNPKDFKLYSNRATTFCKLMKWGAALDDCDTALKINPKFQKVLIRKGKIQHVLKQYHKALKCFEAAELIDPNVSDLKKAKMETMMAIQQRNMQGSQDDDKQAQARAMQDPEVQAALKDPEVSSVLLQAQSGDPSILRKAMMDKPRIRKKIETLIAAGVLRMG